LANNRLIPELIHNTTHYASKRAALSDEPIRVKERRVRKLKSVEQAQRFLDIDAAVYNLFNLESHLVLVGNLSVF
jgi:putative transposase